MRSSPPQIAALLTGLALAGCQLAPPPPASQYRVMQATPSLGLSFFPGEAQLPAPQLATLQATGRTLPEEVVPVLYTDGRLAQARADRVGRALQRPIRLVVQRGAQPDQAMLVFPVRSGRIVADACRGPGARLVGDIWPGDDSNAVRLLPPGCSTEADIAAQVSQPGDLLYGRPLPPGAALPYAEAIEQYYHRADTAHSTAGSPPGGGGSGSASGSAAGSGGGGLTSPGTEGTGWSDSSSGGASGGGIAAGTGQTANPLLGPATR